MLMRVLRLYEPEKHRALAHVLRPGMTFVDVGACKGDFALFAAGRVGPQGRVVAVEPEPGNARWLRKSIIRNEVRNVEVHELALSDEHGQSVLHRADITAGVEVSSGWHTLVSTTTGEDEDIEIETQTLDELLGRLGLEQVDVIKIDVEGWEVAVLRGATETLTRQPSPPIVMMDLHPGLGVDPHVIAEILHGHGFELFCMSSPTKRLDVRNDTVEIIARPRGQPSRPAAGAVAS